MTIHHISRDNEILDPALKKIFHLHKRNKNFQQDYNLAYLNTLYPLERKCKDVLIHIYMQTIWFPISYVRDIQPKNQIVNLISKAICL